MINLISWQDRQYHSSKSNHRKWSGQQCPVLVWIFLQGWKPCQSCSLLRHIILMYTCLGRPCDRGLVHHSPVLKSTVTLKQGRKPPMQRIVAASQRWLEPAGSHKSLTL